MLKKEMVGSMYSEMRADLCGCVSVFVFKVLFQSVNVFHLLNKSCLEKIYIMPVLHTDKYTNFSP